MSPELELALNIYIPASLVSGFLTTIFLGLADSFSSLTKPGWVIYILTGAVGIITVWIGIGLVIAIGYIYNKLFFKY